MISEHVLQRAPWAPSKLDCLAECSQKFDFQYIGKIKEATKGREATDGIIIHSMLERMLHRPLPPPPLDMPDAERVDYLKRNSLRGATLEMALEERDANYTLTVEDDERLSMFHENMVAFVERFARFRERENIMDSCVWVERKAGITSDFKATGFFDPNCFFRGAIDYMLLIPQTSTVLIIDHKTGKQNPLEEYKLQFRAYALLAHALYPGLRQVQTGLHFVATGNLVFDKAVSAATIQNEYRPWLLNELETVGANLLTAPTPHKSRLCDWCGYKALCPGFGGPGRGTTQGR